MRSIIHLFRCVWSINVYASTCVHRIFSPNFNFLCCSFVRMYFVWQWLILMKKFYRKISFQIWYYKWHQPQQQQQQKQQRLVPVNEASVCVMRNAMDVREIDGKFKYALWNVKRNYINDSIYFYMHILYPYDKIHDVQPISIPYFFDHCVRFDPFSRSAYLSVYIFWCTF